MATSDKDFKVKNGIQVAGDGTFGGNIIAADPTAAGHVATKSYVDSLAGGVPVDSTAPSSPSNGDMWFDTNVNRVNVYYNGVWLTIATINDTLNIPDHIHDTSIDGNGLITTIFVDGGSFNDPQGTSVDGGTPETTDFAESYNGGIVTDQYN